MLFRRFALLAVALAFAASFAASLLAPALASAQVEPYGTNDFGGFRNILPPGTNGLVDLTQLAAYEANSSDKPPHNDDQLQMYSNLTTAAPNIQAAQIPDFYKDATFGVQPANVGSTESPEAGVTIVRDKQFSVPHIYGDTRAELMFGIGWATAEDRLFFIDALRHAGNADLAQFAGGANVSMDESVWASSPYTPQDLQQQVNYGITHSADGPQIYADTQNYIDGINAYITKAQNPLYTATMMPAEYTAIGQPQGPAPFTVDDLISIASLVGGIFGQGGGGQLNNAILYEQLKKQFGTERENAPGSPEGVVKTGKGRAHRAAPDHSGFGTFLSFDDPSDPEAPTTIHGKSFAYQTLALPSKIKRASIALPDPGSVKFASVVAGGAPPNSPDRSAAVMGSPSGKVGTAASPGANGGSGLFAFPRAMSNALLVSGAHSASGHPIAVMGPQVAYFAPEILMEEDIHGPGIDADGAAFPGVNLYVELGHGPDYAWSATSAGQNIIDTFAVPLCNPSGGAVSTTSDDYVDDGQCVPMETLQRQESWTPNAADSTPAGSITLSTQRTAFGIVIARATVHGKPVAYTNLRSTYMHELDSALGFEKLNEPAQIRTPQDFFNAASEIDYTFNWFYTDDKHIAYFNSGLNPVRAPGTDPLFPSWSSYDWRGWNQSTRTEADTSENAHPHAVDQEYFTSWNNKQAPGFNDAATGQEFSSVYRSQLLDNNIKHYLDGGRHKLTLVDLINAMGNAGTQDLRGVEVLPYALKVIGHPTDSTLAPALAELRAWVASGAHRINREHPGTSGNYDQTDAVRIMDAWWPLLIRSEFTPVLSSTLLGDVEGQFATNDEPGHGTSGAHLGSSWDVGFYGIVQKDLRAVLGQPVTGSLNRIFCGSGSLRACRTALESSLRAAIAETPQQVYPTDGVCSAGDQMCSDSIQFRPIGAVKQPLIEWINRPTFQQAVEIQGHGPR